MAQYQHSFYGSSYYGETNAFSGTYETADILTEEPLKNTINVSIKALLPHANYPYSSQEYTQTGTWTASGSYLSTSQANAKLTFTATCDRIVINYQRLAAGSTAVALKLTTTVPGQSSVVTNYTLNTSGATSDQQYVITDLPYGQQILEMTVPSGTFNFASIDARVSSFTIETRAKTGANGIYTAYAPITLTTTPVSGDNYTIAGTSPNYAGYDRIQVRVWMASSDNSVSPVIDELDTYAGDTNNRTDNGTYVAKLYMQQIASNLGVSFGEIQSINWASAEPTGTKITIRSRSANSGETIWSPLTVPYRKNVHRLRLKEGIGQGYITTPLMNPASVNPNLRIDHWIKWNDTSYLPPDESSTRILYEFLDENNAVFYKADNPKYITDRNLMLNVVGNKPYRVKITITRRIDKASPAVDNISLTSSLIYEERKITEEYGFSAVDNNNTGEQMILDMSTLIFNPPAEATSPTYFLEDQTQRPRDVLLYLQSTNNLPPSISRPNYTKDHSDKIWAKIFEDIKPTDGTVTGVYKHYQYGGGTVVINQPDEIVLAPAFTPVLDTTKEYRYFIELGWFDSSKQTMNSSTVNDSVSAYWKSQQNLARTQITEWSSHNALVKNSSDKTSDTIVLEVVEASTWGEVDWVSEEKIYFGIVNMNDEKTDYTRTHITPDSGDSVEIKYKVQAGDTFASIAVAFQVEESDIRYVNDVDSGDPAVGSTIIIPPRIVLPKINPAASITDNPYKIDIVYNSVRQGNKIVPESRIIIGDIAIEEEEVTITKEKVQRGDITNGKDVLGNAKVTSVIGIWDSVDDPIQMPVYIANQDYAVEGNFIDWGISDQFSLEPSAGDYYYVTYKCMKPKTVTVTMSCDYQEQSGIDRVWRSPEVKLFSGTCSPGVDYRAELPEANTWEGASDPDIDDLIYIIEDNDLWVKTWTEEQDAKNYIVGSLQDRIPKDNWFPYIHTGYYYMGQDEYYLFSEPTQVTPSDDEMARAANVTYIEGKYGNAVRFESGSQNKIRNSGFEITSTKRVIQKVTF